MTWRILPAVIAASFGLAGSDAFADPPTYRPIDVACEAAATACPTGLVAGHVAPQTSARGINARGDIVGFYVDGAGRQHGFVLKDGQYASVDFPLPGIRSTIANGINPQGEIVGQYTLPVNTDPNVLSDSPLYCPQAADAACIKGFLLSRGRFSTIMFPDHPGAIGQRITPDGDIYGCLHDHDTGMSMFGAAWSRSFDGKGSVVITPQFSMTFAGGELADPTAVPMSMNNGATPGGAQTIIGLFTDMAGQQHGYVVQNRVLEPRPYDPTPNANLTAIWDINPREEFVGTYRLRGEVATKRHGFLQLPDGSAPIDLDVSFTDAFGQTITAFATIAYGISPNSVVVGQYAQVSNGPVHGFAVVMRGY